MVIYNFSVSAVGSREELADSLRIIANALDGRRATVAEPSEHDQQAVEDINNSFWNDCIAETTMTKIRTH